MSRFYPRRIWTSESPPSGNGTMQVTANNERRSIASGYYHSPRHVRASGKPTEYRKIADSGNVRLQGFCLQCGTALYATSIDDQPKAYNVRLGALRQRNDLVPRRQIFVRSQQAWVNDLNSIPKFDGPRH